MRLVGNDSARSGEPRREVEALFIEKAQGGWTMKIAGTPRRYFGTSFMALQTAIGSARAAVAAGCPTSVLIERPDGGWRTAWSPDEPYIA